MPISALCPRCGASLQAPDSLIGQNVQCPRCANQFAVSSTSSAPPAAIPVGQVLSEGDDGQGQIAQGVTSLIGGIAAYIFAMLVGVVWAIAPFGVSIAVCLVGKLATMFALGYSVRAFFLKPSWQAVCGGIAAFLAVLVIGALLLMNMITLGVYASLSRTIRQ